MKTLIVYASKYSSTKACAERIATALTDEVVVYSAQNAPNPQDYDNIVLGSAIYSGASLPDMQDYCKKYIDTLLQHPLHLFICCINPKPTVIEKQLQAAFPPALHQHATQAINFGGTVNLEKLTIAEKAMMRLLGYAKTQSTINDTAIEQFTSRLP